MENKSGGKVVRAAKAKVIMKGAQKNKKTQQQAQPVIESKGLGSFLPLWLVYPALIAWAVFVYVQYTNTLSIPSITLLFNGIDFDPVMFLPRALEHLVNIFYAVLIAASAFTLGNLVLKLLLKPEAQLDSSALEKFIFSEALGLGLFAAAVLFMGLAGFLYKTVFLVIIFGLGLYGIYTLFGMKSNASTEKWDLSEKLLFLAIALIALYNLPGALTPELFYDSQFYQLGIPVKWILEHRIRSFAYIPPSYLPFNINMLYTAAMLVNNEITAKLVHYICGLTVVCAIYVFSKKYFDRRTAFISALIFYSVPQVMTVSWKTAVELGIGVFDFCSVYAIINHWRSKNISWLVIAGVLSGFSVGSKYTGIAFCFIPAVVMILVSSINNKDTMKNMILFAGVFIAAVAVAGAPWYIKNIINTGNPIFPFFSDKVGFIHIRNAGGLMNDPAHPQLNFMNYIFFIWPMTMGSLQQETFLGPVFLLFLPLAFMFVKGVDSKIKIIFSYFVVALVLWAYAGRFYLRYFIPTLTVASILAGYYISTNNAGKAFKNILIYVVIFAAFMNVSFVGGIYKSCQDPLLYASGMVDKKDYLSTQRPSFPCAYYQVVEYANKNLDKNAKIVFLGDSRGLYFERDFYANGAGDYCPLIEWVKKSKSADEFYGMLKQNGVTHIMLNMPEARRLVAYDNFYWQGKDLLVFNDFWNKYLVEIHKDIGDIAVPQQGITSLKKSHPEWWVRYASDPKNYVYLYRIESPDELKQKQAAPYNFLLDKGMYNAERITKFEMPQHQ